jgi:hypothetical protein
VAEKASWDLANQQHDEQRKFDSAAQANHPENFFVSTVHTTKTIKNIIDSATPNVS